MKLLYLNGPMSGEVIELIPPSLTLGRETDNDVSLLIEGVSRYHAKLEFIDNTWVIKDLGSTNGTKVEGLAITKPYVLVGGELISLGEQKFKYDAGTNLVSSPAVPSNSTNSISNAHSSSSIPPIQNTGIPTQNNVPPTPPAQNIGSPIQSAGKPPQTSIPSTQNDVPHTPSTQNVTPTLTPTPNPANIGTPPPVTFTPSSGPQNSGNISFEVPPSPQSKSSAGVFSPSSIDIDSGIPNMGTNNAKDESVKEDVNFFGRKTNSDANNDKKSNFLLNALFYIGVIFAAIIMIILFLNSEEKSTKKAPAVSTKKSEAPFLMIYDKQVTTSDNIFRFYIQIENKSVQITLDDLKFNRHISDPKELSDEQLNELKHNIKQSRFMQLHGVQSGTAKGNNDDTRKIAVYIDGKYNEVTVKNCALPSSFIILEEVIEDLTFSQWGVQSVTLTPQELKKAARNSFEIAQSKFNNYEANPMNLTLAIKHYKLVMENLNSFPNKPSYWETARKNKAVAEEILNKKIKALVFNANQALQMDNVIKSREAYVEITKMLDTLDPRYIKARKMIIKYDTYLNNLKKR